MCIYVHPILCYTKLVLAFLFLCTLNQVRFMFLQCGLNTSNMRFFLEQADNCCALNVDLDLQNQSLKCTHIWIHYIFCEHHFSIFHQFIIKTHLVNILTLPLHTSCSY